MSDPTERPDPRTPILVGVGTAARPAASTEDVEPVELMTEAAAAAIADTGAPGIAARLGTIAVPVGNWDYPDPARLVGERIGSSGAGSIRVEIGVPQHTPIRVAAQRIRRGELDAAMVVGGEAKATQLRVQRRGDTPVETPQPGVEAAETWSPQGELMAQAEIDAGIWAPVEQYACIDNALRFADGLGVDAHLDQIATLWERMNVVARTNPLAAFPEPRDAAFLRVAGPGNRPLAFPYAKWHSTQWAVDQAAAMVLCSVGTARELGIPSDRWVFPRVLAESSHSLSLTKRAAMHRWPAMQVLGAAAADHLGTALEDIAHTEVYSCFPAAVRVQQRELGLDPAATPSVMGGMAFAGGPFNNFSYQSTAAIIGRVRQDPGSLGMVTTVSGLLTKPALAVWSTEPGPDGALVVDLADRAAAATAEVGVTGTHDGTGTVATYTVTYEDGAPASAFVVADIGPNLRWIGTSDEPDLLAAGVTSELIGTRVSISGRRCGST